LAKGGTQSVQPEAETRPPSDLDDLPADMPLSSPLPAEAARKPARIKLNYRRFEVFVSEYRENMRKGGTFIKTDKPLTPGRMCVFEVKVPGVPEPVLFDAVVSWVQDGSVGDRGMGVEYRMDERQRYQIERLLKGV
jgi:type IV pilus assembly protein PilZ